MQFTTLALGLIASMAPQALATPINSVDSVSLDPTCISDPSGFMTMIDAQSCLDEIAALGTKQITTKAPGQAMCTRTSGLMWAGIGGDESQSASA